MKYSLKEELFDDLVLFLNRDCKELDKYFVKKAITKICGINQKLMRSCQDLKVSLKNLFLKLSDRKK